MTVSPNIALPAGERRWPAITRNQGSRRSVSTRISSAMFPTSPTRSRRGSPDHLVGDPFGESRDAVFLMGEREFAELADVPDRLPVGLVVLLGDHVQHDQRLVERCREVVGDRRDLLQSFRLVCYEDRHAGRTTCRLKDIVGATAAGHSAVLLPSGTSEVTRLRLRFTRVLLPPCSSADRLMQ